MLRNFYIVIVVLEPARFLEYCRLIFLLTF
nr:MAG TPA: hypothetical protein [Herelleviridae sp.]